MSKDLTPREGVIIFYTALDGAVRIEVFSKRDRSEGIVRKLSCQNMRWRKLIDEAFLRILWNLSCKSRSRLLMNMEIRGHISP